MERFISLVKVTERGHEEFLKAGDYFAQFKEIVDSFGGKFEALWATYGGPWEFVSIVTYPDRIAGLKARTRIEALGVVKFEFYPLFEVDEWIQAVVAA